jgi:S1-C subfamily serine protease
VFSRFRLITDYAHDELWLVADAKALAEPFLKNRAGLLSLPAGDRLKVLMVAPGSPAERAGWKEGAEIVAVNGQKIGAAYRTSVLSHWATQAAGTRVALTLVDGSTRELILADYF